LSTKIRVPQLRRSLVPRERQALAEALPERLHEPLRLTDIGADPGRVPVPSLVNALGDLADERAVLVLDDNRHCR
jgi:hypothetical protein